MAHARRKIHDEHTRRPTDMTNEALKRIAALYVIEAEIRGLPSGERLIAQKGLDGTADAVVTRLDTGADENSVGSR